MPSGQVIASSWRDWWSLALTPSGPFWLQWVWTGAFCLVIAVGLSTATWLIRGGYPGFARLWEFFVANLVITLTVGGRVPRRLPLGNGGSRWSPATGAASPGCPARTTTSNICAAKPSRGWRKSRALSARRYAGAICRKASNSLVTTWESMRVIVSVQALVVPHPGVVFDQLIAQMRAQAQSAGRSAEASR
jgi:hypothetical protein